MADKYVYKKPYEEETGLVVVPDYYVAPPSDSGDTTPTESTSSWQFPSLRLVDLFPELFSPKAAQPKRINSVAKIANNISALQTGDPIPYVYGRTTIAPKIIAAHADDDYLYVDYLVSKGEINQFVKLYQGGDDVGLPSTDFEYFTGTSGQSASTIMAGVLGSYDALPDIAHFVVKLSRSDSMDFRVLLEGIKTFDPRTSPRANAYSANPALALGHMLESCGYTLDYDSLSTVANMCDEDVGGSARWECHVPCESRRNVGAWIQAFSQYAHCYLDIIGGSVTFIPDAAVTSSPAVTRTVTNADIVAGSAKTTKSGVKDVPEQVTVNYREEDGTSRSAVVGSGAVGRRTRLSLPGFQTYTMAKRHATELLNKVQADLRHQHIAHDEAITDAIGDIHSITYAPHGLTDKLMRLVGLQEKERGRWQRSYVEYDPALYSDSVFSAPSLGDTDLISPNTPPTGPTPTVTEELYTDETATTYSRLKIQFTGSSWPYAQAYRVTAEGEQNVLNTLIANEGQTTHTVYTAALKQGVNYSINVYIQSVTGVLSETAGTANQTAAGKLLPPGDVPSLNGYEAGNLVALNWGAAEEITGDLRGYIIKRLPGAEYTGTSADWTNANVITIADRVDATTYLTAAQPSGTWYYGVKAVDNAGNTSTNARWQRVVVTDSDTVVNFASLDSGSLTNMHLYRIDGDAYYVITDTGQTWAERFVDSPATWAGNLSPGTERWGGDLATDSEFQTEIWDIGKEKTGNWVLDTTNITLLGGTQSTTIALGDNSSPIVFTNHSGSSVNANGQNFKAIISTTDSPASPGDGLYVKLPAQASFGGSVIEETGTATIAAASPLDNPKAVTFTDAFSSAPDVRLTVQGGTAKIAAYDNLTTTGMDIYLWDTSGNLVDGAVDWYVKGS